MYNAALKLKFIDSLESDYLKSKAREVFDYVEKFEEEFDKDLCSMSMSEVQKVMNSVVGIRYASSALRTGVLKKYGNWCLDESVEGANENTLRCEADTSYKMAMQTVSCPDDLQGYLDGMLYPETEQTTDNVIRVYLWMAYGGIPEADIFEIKTRDVDFLDRVVRYNGFEYPIYDIAIPAFMNCAYLNSFRQYMPVHPTHVYRRDRAPGDQLIRGIKAEQNVTTMRVSLSKLAKKAYGSDGVRLSYYRVWLSGVFYRKYCDELKGIEPDFSDIAAYSMSGRTYRDGSDYHTKKERARIIREYHRDYSIWKKTIQKK